MSPRDRKLMGRLMIVASVLVGLMVAAMLWTTLQSGGRGPAPGPPQPGAPSEP